MPLQGRLPQGVSLKIDERLKEFCTPRQWEMLDAVNTHGGYRAAGRALKTSYQNIQRAHDVVKRRAAARGFSPEHGLTHIVPDGFRLRGSSIYYDATGAIRGQWVKSEPDKSRFDLVVKEAINAAVEEIKRIPTIRPPRHTNDSLLAVYPVGDHHMGMFSWREETGADYDLRISEALLVHAANHLLASNPPAEKALIIFLGDFLHYDSFEAETPTNHNRLDADSRFPKMVRSAVHTMRYMIEEAAKKHNAVHVIVEIGNHDLSSSIWVMELLSNLYRDNPRIAVDVSPSHFHYFQFGQCLIGTHHGHGVRLDRLPIIMATEKSIEWGNTKHRYWYTGHVHHRSASDTIQRAKDFNGCSVESFRVLAPPDAWAAQKGYQPIRDMHSIILHKDYGEVSRNRVSPEMFNDAPPNP